MILPMRISRRRAESFGGGICLSFWLPEATLASSKPVGYSTVGKHR
jgi:hypothetical protein